MFTKNCLIIVNEFVNYICEQTSIVLYIYRKLERSTCAVLEWLVKLKVFKYKIIIYICLCKIIIQHSTEPCALKDYIRIYTQSSTLHIVFLS